MKKRLNKKVINISNKKILNTYLNTFLNKSGLSINKYLGIEFKNSYYFLKHNSRDVEFFLNELPDWRLCFSLDFYGDGVVRFFGEHKLLIDKFRPSSTYISETDLNSFIKKVQEIILKPKYHFVNSLTFNRLDNDYLEKTFDDGESYAVGYQAVYDKEKHKYYRDETILLKDFIDYKYKKFFEDKKSSYLLKINERENLLNILKNNYLNNYDVLNAGLVDKDIDGSYNYPRYIVNLIVKEDYFNDKASYLFKELENLFIEHSDVEIGYISSFKKDVKELNYKIK